VHGAIENRPIPMTGSSDPFDEKKRFLVDHFDQMAQERPRWIERNRYYHESVERLVQRFVEPNSAVLVLGCGTGSLLPTLRANPERSVGVDISPTMVSLAGATYPEYQFIVGDAERLALQGADGNGSPSTPTFDAIVLADVVGYLKDVESCLRDLRRYCHGRTRLIVTHYNMLWEPILKLGERIGWKMPQETQNWLSMHDLRNMLRLADFEIDTSGAALLLPKHVPILSALLNSVAPRLPIARELCLVQYFCAEPDPLAQEKVQRCEQPSCSVIIPCRNEVQNIEDAVERVPSMGKHTQIIFVDGNSNDGTVEKIEDMIARYRGRKDISLIHQVPREGPGANTTAPDKMLRLGKGDAVRKGFDAAQGDILMILDADLTVAPEDLPNLFWPLAEDKAELVNGCRLVYPMEDEAMRFINLCGNKAFSLAFTWLLGQPVKDTLCGTKTLFKRDYERIKANRSYFGEFDPFGDFDLLFGAARLGFRIVDMPIRYRRRVAGRSKVSVLGHGILLVHMVAIGFKKLKLDVWLRRDRGPVHQ
jgi:glycosyltransferase involved in cell wall biosynthesis/SAM-dependent methyltransferase